MTDEPVTRNWSTKTLARQLALYLSESELNATSTVQDLIDALKSSIVEEEVGVSLDLWDES